MTGRGEIRAALDAVGLLRSGELFDTTPDEMESRRLGESVPLMCAYGGGLNSSAGLVLLAAWGDVPDAVLMADTGGEKGRTYAYVERFADWMASAGFPRLVSVRRTVDHDRQNLCVGVRHADAVPRAGVRRRVRPDWRLPAPDAVPGVRREWNAMLRCWHVWWRVWNGGRFVLRCDRCGCVSGA